MTNISNQKVQERETIHDMAILYGDMWRDRPSHLELVLLAVEVVGVFAEVGCHEGSA